MKTYWKLDSWPFPNIIDQYFCKCWLFFGIAQYCAISLKSEEICDVSPNLEFWCFQYVKWNNWCEFHDKSLIFTGDIQLFVIFKPVCVPDLSGGIKIWPSLKKLISKIFVF